MKLLVISKCFLTTTFLTSICFAAGAVKCPPRARFQSPLFVNIQQGPTPPKADQIIVYKDVHELLLLKRGFVIDRYRISLGLDPVGHKIQVGDMKTPEGRYKIDLKKPSELYHLGLRISYPDIFDRERAQKLGVDPGGEIYLHGFPTDPEERARVEAIHGKQDWTRGCIGLTDPEIEDIYNRVDEGTMIMICPNSAGGQVGP